ncbi:hypothetical protein ABT234_11590 [Streptomyces sp. NPDC001586]|uniref:hypothetical protein n=1 Tax=Streptomyces sp. NPDC001586 TaxID=3154387 RepID=UPI00331DD668
MSTYLPALALLVLLATGLLAWAVGLLLLLVGAARAVAAGWQAAVAAAVRRL